MELSIWSFDFFIIFAEVQEEAHSFEKAQYFSAVAVHHEDGCHSGSKRIELELPVARQCTAPVAGDDARSHTSWTGAEQVEAS